MELAWLCQIDAFARVGGAATTFRLASHDDARLCHLNGQTWWPSIARLPTFAYDFFDGAFGGAIVTPSGRTEIAALGVPDFAAAMFHDARIRWWSGELGAAWDDFVLRFDGLIENQPGMAANVANLDFRVDDRWLDDPVLATYAGTTGAEGEAALKGQVKPLLLGAPRMVEGVLIDSIDTIIQLSDGAIEGVEVAYENAQRFAAPVANHASFAAIDAATIAPGFIDTALAVGLTRHGAPGDGVLTYDVKGSNSGSDGGGWVRKPGAIVKRLAARQGRLAKVDLAAMAALDIARPWNVSLAVTQQTTMRELVQSLAQSINAVALVTWTGLLTILPIDPPEDATAVGTLASDGTALPPVARVDQLGIAAPWWRVAIEAEVTQRVHSTDEIRFTANLIEVGIYDAGTTYREGNIASIADGSRWLYTSATPTAGNMPSDASAYWQRLSEAATGPAGPPGDPGAPGDDGADGSSVDAVFKRSATQPSTPAPGITSPPSGWYADIASVPAGGNPLWSSIGSQTDPTSNWLWNVPVQIEGQDGAPGAPGADGVPLYTWYAYADAPDGGFNFTTGSPGDRTYQGIATGKTTATESTNKADYDWSPYVGPPNFGLAALGTVVAGNKLIRTASGSWDMSLHSTESFKGGASVSFVLDALVTGVFIGLNTDPTTNASYSSIDFAIYMTATTYEVWENGAGVVGSGATPSIGDVLTVTYNGRKVDYALNGTVFHTNNSPGADLTLFFDSSMDGAAGQYGRVLSFTAAGTAGDPGAPGDDGDDGISPVLATASPSSKQFTADADGTVKTGQLAFPVTVAATKAGAPIGGDTTILSVSGCTATATSSGFTFDTISADEGYAEWEFEASDGQTVVGRVSFSRQRDPTGGGQVLVNFNSTAWWGSGSYGSSGPGTVLAASSTGKLKLTGYASFYSSTNGSATLTGKLQYRAVGSGTWIDAGISDSGVATRTIGVPGEPDDNTPGVIAISGTVTGLTADGSYEMQMVGNRSSGGTAISSATGYVSMQQVT